MELGGHPHTGPVRVLVLDGKRHVLDHSQDSRVTVLAADSAEPPDLVFLPAAKWRRFEASVAAITPAMVQRIAGGRAVLVLDASGEGMPFDPGNAQAFHSLLKQFRLPAGRVAYLTQNRDYQVGYERWCGQSITPMKVVIYDYYVSRFFREHVADGAEVYAERLAKFESRGRERERRFVCLNLTPRAGKVLLLLALLKDGLWDEGFISFSGFDKAAHRRAVLREDMEKDLAGGLAGLEGVVEELLPWLDPLEAKGAISLFMPGGVMRQFKTAATDFALEEYQRSWFTVITETEVIGTRRVTEKPLKALANLSPLLLWGNRGSLDLLRDWGFRTFDGVFDEGYDLDSDPTIRFTRVRAEIRRLCALSQAEMAGAEAKLADVLAHNARHALVDMPARYRDVLEPALIETLLAMRVS
jgi:hypothetical protein